VVQHTAHPLCRTGPHLGVRTVDGVYTLQYVRMGVWAWCMLCLPNQQVKRLSAGVRCMHRVWCRLSYASLTWLGIGDSLCNTVRQTVHPFRGDQSGFCVCTSCGAFHGVWCMAFAQCMVYNNTVQPTVHPLCRGRGQLLVYGVCMPYGACEYGVCCITYTSH
jgi:hypothetical protein